ncbi:MAG: hypothetical protein RBT70_02785 [Alphaproteobacteria bacterium]|nr:hypothetical protein [Alphaproteobacteria bacterium]
MSDLGDFFETAFILEGATFTFADTDFFAPATSVPLGLRVADFGIAAFTDFATALREASLEDPDFFGLDLGFSNRGLRALAAFNGFVGIRFLLTI